jgi:phage shock protein PspC (stress-responsive transcriptional regulator)
MTDDQGGPRDPVGGPSTSPPPPPPPPRPTGTAPRRLRRRSQGAPLGGVCAGIAEHLGVDVTIVRLVAVVLAITGPGVIAYLIAWVVIPDDRTTPIAASGTRSGSRPVEQGAQAAGIALLAVAAALVWSRWSWPGSGLLLPAGLVAAGVWLLTRTVSGDDLDQRWSDEVDHAPADRWSAEVRDAPADRLWSGGADGPDDDPRGSGDPTDGGSGTAGWASPPPADRPGPDPSWSAPPVGPQPGSWDSTPEPEDPRSRAVVGATVGALLIWFGVAALVGVALEVALAVGLGLVGAGLVVGAFTGRSRLLILPALALLGLLVGTAVLDVPLRGGVGERSWAPASVDEVASEYRLAAGEATLDLRAVVPPAGPGAEDVVVTASVAAGELLVLVPEGVALDIRAKATAGEINLLGTTDTGIDVRQQASAAGPDGMATIVLDLAVGFGTVEVQARLPVDGSDPTTATTAELPG